MLFKEVDFISHAGVPLSWKLECEALSIAEWSCLAKMILEYEKRPFSIAMGIPRGGVLLANALDRYGNIMPGWPIADGNTYAASSALIDFGDGSLKIFASQASGAISRKSHLLDYGASTPHTNPPQILLSTKAKLLRLDSRLHSKFYLALHHINFQSIQSNLLCIAPLPFIDSRNVVHSLCVGN